MKNEITKKATELKGTITPSFNNNVITTAIKEHKKKGGNGFSDVKSIRKSLPKKEDEGAEFALWEMLVLVAVGVAMIWIIKG